MRALLVVLLFVTSGCIGLGTNDTPNPPTELPDLPMQPVQSPYYDVVPAQKTWLRHNTEYLVAGITGDETFGFHSFAELEAELFDWNATYPELVDLKIAGYSHEGNPIYHVIVTDESIPPDDKVAPMFEGGIHGNEYGGSELFLYTVDALLENHATNATVRSMLQTLEIHVLPTVNPDGYISGKRTNANGVNLNRNWDVDWGNPAGASNPVMGQIGEASGQPVAGVAVVAENCGASAFSEPETQAARDVFLSLGDRAALHLAGHSPTNAVITVPAAYDPPFEVPPERATVLDAELDWVRTNTEYEAGRAQWGDLSAGLPYAASGSSMDWFYLALDKPAFTIEVEYFPTAATSSDYPGRLTQDYEGLRFWMDTSLPFTLHLLANAHALANWETPGTEPPLPEGWTQHALPERAEPPGMLRYLH